MLSNQAALVTGAASGIGRALAMDLAARGVGGLALLDIDADGLAETASAINVPTVEITVDVRDGTALEAAFARASDAFNGLNYVCNNVGIMTGFPPFPETPLENIERIIAINFKAVVIGTQLAFRHIEAAGGGAILNTSSGAGKVPLPTDPVYAATKSAVNHLCTSCAGEFARRGVRINTICPGVVNTAILQQNEHPEYAPQSSAEWIESMGMAMLEPETIATTGVDLLLDPEQNGQCVSVLNPRI